MLSCEVRNLAANMMTPKIALTVALAAGFLLFSVTDAEITAEDINAGLAEVQAKIKENEPLIKAMVQQLQACLAADLQSAGVNVEELTLENLQNVDLEALTNGAVSCVQEIQAKLNA